MGFGFGKLRLRPAAHLATTDASTSPYASDSEPSVIKAGDAVYARAQGGNGSLPSYQDVLGAPVERDSPLGYHVGWVTVIFLNINQMIGTGIFSTRRSLLYPIIAMRNARG